MYRKDGTNSANKVYSWENALIREYGSSKETNQFNIKESKSFASLIWNKYKNKLFKNYPNNTMYCAGVNILKGYGMTATAYSGFTRHKRNRNTSKGLPIYYRKLRLPNWAMNKPIICHEVAHLLAPRGSGHNEDFIGIYMYLLNNYCGYDYKLMIKTLNEVELNFTFRNSKTLYKKTLPFLR